MLKKGGEILLASSFLSLSLFFTPVLSAQQPTPADRKTFDASYLEGRLLFYEALKQNVPPTRWSAYLAAAGMFWAAQNRADIISLSLAFTTDTKPLRDASKLCWEKNGENAV